MKSDLRSHLMLNQADACRRIITQNTFPRRLTGAACLDTAREEC